MDELELSSMVDGSTLLLPEYEKQSHNQMRYRHFDWPTAWNELLQIALYMKGPDVSEVGTTWLESLDGMNALRPFTRQEIQLLGGLGSFVPGSWLERTQMGQTQVLSIPWIADTRLVYYRKDYLRQAGVDETTAFSSAAKMLETLAKLQASGFETPLAMITHGELVLHYLASWVWGAGGMFRSPDCKRITLVEPEAIRGVVDFLKMHPYIDPALHGAEAGTTDQTFLQGKTAVLVSGHWVAHQLVFDPTVDEEVRKNCVTCLVPGVPFVGGASLVVWRHTLHDRAVLGLLQHLIGERVLMRIFEETRNVPAYLASLEKPPFSTDPHLKVVAQSIKVGRRMRSAYRWAGVEMRLNVLMTQLWADAFQNPHINLEKEVPARVNEVAGRLERTLLADW